MCSTYSGFSALEASRFLYSKSLLYLKLSTSLCGIAGGGVGCIIMVGEMCLGVNRYKKTMGIILESKA